MKWTDELDGEFNGNPCKIRVGVSADDLINHNVSSFRASFIKKKKKKQEVDLLYYCRCQLVDIITMIDVANTTDDLNLELLKVLVGDIKNVFGDKL